MCGIVGVIAKSNNCLFKCHLDLFQQMFLVDQLRGTDGAGIIMNSKAGIETLKVPYRAGSFMVGDEFQKAIATANKEGHFIIGHNRASTRGKNTWENTHPFSEGSISLVHNGTLFDHKNLDKELEVDSHAICKHMATNGVKDTLKEIDGAFALVWVDDDDWTINLARNKERPLHLIETNLCWIISSELGLGLWMAERHKMNVMVAFQLETETLYTFDINNLSTYKTEKVEYRKPNFYPYVHHSSKGTYSKDDVGSLFKSRRQRFLEKKAGKGIQTDDDDVWGTNPKKNDVVPTRGFGTKIKFQPARFANGVPATAIIHDAQRETNFLLGKVFNEPNTEIRVYGKSVILEELACCDVLEGTIYLTSIKGKKTSYQLSNVTVINSEPLYEDALEEFALTKYCDKNGISNSPNTEITCDCCSTKVLRKEVVMRAGKPLCNTCGEAFSVNKGLAKEMGYN